MVGTIRDIMETVQDTLMVETMVCMVTDTSETDTSETDTVEEQASLQEEL